MLNSARPIPDMWSQFLYAAIVVAASQKLFLRVFIRHGKDAGGLKLYQPVQTQEVDFQMVIELWIDPW